MAGEVRNRVQESGEGFRIPPCNTVLLLGTFGIVSSTRPRRRAWSCWLVALSAVAVSCSEAERVLVKAIIRF